MKPVVVAAIPMLIACGPLSRLINTASSEQKSEERQTFGLNDESLLPQQTQVDLAVNETDNAISLRDALMNQQGLTEEAAGTLLRRWIGAFSLRSLDTQPAKDADPPVDFSWEGNVSGHYRMVVSFEINTSTPCLEFAEPTCSPPDCSIEINGGQGSATATTANSNYGPGDPDDVLSAALVACLATWDAACNRAPIFDVNITTDIFPDETPSAPPKTNHEVEPYSMAGRASFLSTRRIEEESLDAKIRISQDLVDYAAQVSFSELAFSTTWSWRHLSEAERQAAVAAQSCPEGDEGLSDELLLGVGYGCLESPTGRTVQGRLQPFQMEPLPTTYTYGYAETPSAAAAVGLGAQGLTNDFGAAASFVPAMPLWISELMSIALEIRDSGEPARVRGYYYIDGPYPRCGYQDTRVAGTGRIDLTQDPDAETPEGQ